ncbi:MAG: peptidoglycan DD-metalloendopeptidase family protein, partial [Deltaproteobacteria bacterium]|nr:peptidoglycan DD-metalloendopeptidase family protein [Deltaproteobacteria bacterium]
MSVSPISAYSQAEAPKGPARESQKELKRAVADFESLFINQMFKSMRETIGKSELFHGGKAEDIYTSMLDTELSKNMAQAGGIGLANMLLRQLSDLEPEAPQGESAIPEAPVIEPVQVKAEPAMAAAPVQEETEKFSFPLKELKRISSRFGDRTDPFTGHTRFHHGMDIAANQGTPVYPASGGKVIFSGTKGGYGNMVEILHDDGLVTRYGHNAENTVKEGDLVSPSQAIAYVGSTG